MQKLVILLVLAITSAVVSIGYSTDSLALTEELFGVGTSAVTVQAGSQDGFVKEKSLEAVGAASPFSSTDKITFVRYDWFAHDGGCYEHTWTMEPGTIVKSAEFNYANASRAGSVDELVSDDIGSAGDPFDVTFGDFESVEVTIELISAVGGVC